MLQVEQVLQNRYKLQRQLGNNGVRQTWLALDLQAPPCLQGRVRGWDILKSHSFLY